ncbi:hypothetical protein BTVI_116597 [Pitangus sulphuratus]|nr:hypothetical protein BTVI_116597 [Pitangus sulphuratus]
MYESKWTKLQKYEKSGPPNCTLSVFPEGRMDVCSKEYTGNEKVENNFADRPQNQKSNSISDNINSGGDTLTDHPCFGVLQFMAIAPHPVAGHHQKSLAPPSRLSSIINKKGDLICETGLFASGICEVNLWCGFLDPCALDDMSCRIDDLEKNIADLMTQAGVEELEGENKTPAPNKS